jgi:hypothetical protein
MCAFSARARVRLRQHAVVNVVVLSVAVLVVADWRNHITCHSMAVETQGEMMASHGSFHVVQRHFLIYRSVLRLNAAVAGSTVTKSCCFVNHPPILHIHWLLHV